MIINICRAVIAVLLSISLSACAPKYEKYYTYKFPPTSTGKQCIEQCHKTKSRCLKYCTNDSQLCYANANTQADAEYKKYVKQQKVDGGLIDYDRDSFLDPLQCAKLSCDCEADYRACYKMCGGIVQVNKRCVANCKE